MTLERRDVLAGGVAALAALAGCSAGGGTTTDTPARTESGTPTPSGPQPQSSGTVGMSCSPGAAVEEFFFRPGVLWVEEGAEVTWAPTNRCREQTLAYHPDNDLPLRIPEGAEPWQSPVVQGADQTSSRFSHTFEQPGVYNYAGLHVEFGQVGIVVVGRPDDLDAEPGMQPPDGEEIEPQARERLRFYIDEVRELFGD